MKSEQQINRELLLAREVADKLSRQGREELAIKILRISSQMALRDLQGVEDRHIIICPLCKKQLRTSYEIESYTHTGSCLGCNNSRSDEMEQQLYG